MKKTSLIVFLLLIFLLLAGLKSFSQDINIPLDYFVNKFCYSFRVYHNPDLFFHFENENNVLIVYSSPHVYFCQTAEYEIKNNRLIIYYNTEYCTPWDTPRPENIVNLEYSLQKSDTSFYFNYFIKLENPHVMKDTYSDWLIIEFEEVWDISSRIETGMIRNINGINTVAFPHFIAEVTKGLTIRDAPSTDSKKYTFYLGEEAEEYSFLPAGYEVKILGRTENKVTIGEWTNYWYYVEIQFDWWDYAELDGIGVFRSGKKWDFWAFGEFLDITNDISNEDIPDYVFDNCDQE